MKRKVLSLALCLIMALALSVPALAATATPVQYTAQLDGRSVTFAGYESNAVTYIRLRDLASALEGSEKAFNVDWSGNVISITTGAPYTTKNGTEMAAPFAGEQSCAANPNEVRVNGSAVAMDAIFLTDQADGGYTYFRPQDLMDLLGLNAAQTPDVQPQPTESVDVAAVACSTAWYAHCGGQLVYEFHDNGTGRILKTLSLLSDEIAFTYQVDGNKLRITEPEFSYTWEYDQAGNAFLWDIFAEGRLGTGDYGDLNSEGKLVVTAVTPEQYKPLLALTDAQIEALCSQVAAHYNETLKPSGTYTCLAQDFKEDQSKYTLILRYGISNEEAEELLANGGMPQPNVYVSELWIDKATGAVTSEFDLGSWTATLP